MLFSSGRRKSNTSIVPATSPSGCRRRPPRRRRRFPAASRAQCRSRSRWVGSRQEQPGSESRLARRGRSPEPVAPVSIRSALEGRRESPPDKSTRLSLASERTCSFPQRSVSAGPRSLTDRRLAARRRAARGRRAVSAPAVRRAGFGCRRRSLRQSPGRRLPRCGRQTV